MSHIVELLIPFILSLTFTVFIFYFISTMYVCYMWMLCMWCYSVYFFSRIFGNPLNVPINKFNILYTFFCRLLSLHFNPHFMFVACKYNSFILTLYLSTKFLIRNLFFFGFSLCHKIKIFTHYCTLYSHFYCFTPPRKNIYFLCDIQCHCIRYVLLCILLATR